MKRSLCLLVLTLLILAAAAGSGTAAGIPRIGGTWNLEGTANFGKGFLTDKGTCSLISHIDSNGYEVVTKAFYEGSYWSASDKIYEKTAFSFDLKPEVRIDSKIVTFKAPNGGDFTLFIEQETKCSVEGKITFYEEGVSTEADVEYTLTRNAAPVPVVPPSSLPRIAGTWKTEGKGTLGKNKVTDSGRVVITASDGADGYEVLTGFSAKGEIRDDEGNVLDSYEYNLKPEDFGGEMKIMTLRFPLVFHDNRFEITVESGTRLEAARVGEVEYDSVKPLAGASDSITEFMEAEYVLTKEAPQLSSGSGCNAAGAAPLAVLLLPLLFFFRKY